MSTRTGFPRMDWDTGFLADPKFQHLRDLLPDPIQFGYAGFCYLRLVADAWRTCERRPIRDVVRGIEPWAMTALHDAGLLENELTLKEESFEKWVGDAMKGRSAWAAAKRRSRGESSDVSRSLAESRGVSGSHLPAREGGRVGRDGRVGPRDPVSLELLETWAEKATKP